LTNGAAKMIDACTPARTVLLPVVLACVWLQGCGGGVDPANPHGALGAGSVSTAGVLTPADGTLDVEGRAKALSAPPAPQRPPLSQPARVGVQTSAGCPFVYEIENMLRSGSFTSSNGAVSAACLAAMTTLAQAPAAAQPLTSNAQYTLPGGAVVQVAGMGAGAGASASWAIRTVGRTFYVDSVLGDDRAAGTSPSVNGTRAPWRTLAMVNRTRLLPGDMVVLACNSQWNETLRPFGSGTTTQPIIITAASGCAVPPIIDGTTAIAPSAWQRVSSTVFRTTLPRAPGQLFASTGPFLPAHHPNSTRTDSNEWTGWASLPTNGSTLAGSGAGASQRVTLGAELRLPAGANLQAGMRARFRTHSWIIDEAHVTSVSGSTLTFAAPVSDALEAGIGYYLTGLPWMVDSAGEWHYDTRTSQLTAWMPNSFAPSTTVFASTLDTGVDVTGRQNILVNGLTIRRVGTGVLMRASTGVEIRNNRIEDTSQRGIDAATSSNARVVSNTILRTGSDAIAGFVLGQPLGHAITIQNNLVTDSGVLKSGTRVIGPPQHSAAAIHGVANSVISGNAVVDSGYIGIRLMGNSRVDNNLVLRSCLVLDDCGGIYIWNDRDSQILNNVVAGGRGPLAGKHPREQFSAAQGVYLDEAATNVLVRGNVAFDNDHGVLLHVSSNNQVFDNFVYANRASQMWLQASRARFIATGDMANNHLRGNHFGGFDTAGALTLDNEFGAVDGLARIEGNLAPPTHANPVRMISNVNRTTLNWREWSAQANPALDASQPPLGGAESMNTWYRVAGSNLVPNANYANAAAGWGVWNERSPFARMQDVACPTGRCLRVTAGASPSLVMSPNFSVTKGQWLRLAVDVFKPTNAPLTLALRRGGGGKNGFESLTSESLTLNAPSGWSRHQFVVQANATVNAGDPVTGDLGARLDVSGIAANSEVIVGGFEAVPVQTSVAASASAMLVNAGSTTQVMSCPLPAAQQAFCSSMRRLADRTLVAWPLQVAPRSALMLFGEDPALADADRDGIPDSQDACPLTPRLAAVNARGCAYSQR
jgi:parallel beta-helix repeat protein